MHIVKIFAVIMMVLAAFPITSFSLNRGLKIVTTLPSLVFDIKQIACNNDDITSLIPSGVDPHSYELRVQDISLIMSSDVVISTSHTPVEMMIKRLILSEKLKVKLVEVPKIPGIKIKINPATKQKNLHMPIYDPYNYEVFIRYVAGILSKLNPSCKEEYMKNVERVVNRVEAILKDKPKLDVYAVGVSPATQYAVEWMNVTVIQFFIKEEGVPATSGELIDIERKAASGILKAVVIFRDLFTSANDQAVDLARRYGLKIISVPSPLEPLPVSEKLKNISVGEASERGGMFTYYILGSLAVGTLTLVWLAVAYLRRERILRIEAS